jgi:hypothetical protein
LVLWMNFGQITTTNITYTRSPSYTSMVVIKHEIQTFKVMIVVSLLLLLLLFGI